MTALLQHTTINWAHSMPNRIPIRDIKPNDIIEHAGIDYKIKQFLVLNIKFIKPKIKKTSGIIVTNHVYKIHLLQPNGTIIELNLQPYQRFEVL